MATVTWIDGNGNWTSGDDWSTGSPPGPADDAVVANGGTVSVTTSIAVGSIAISGGGSVNVANSGGTVTVSGNVDGGGFDVDQTSGGGGSTVNIGGTIETGGVFLLGNTDLNAPTTVTAAGLTGSGYVSLYGNIAGGTNIQATLDISAAAPPTLSGYVTIQGDALLEFASGGITDIGANSGLSLVGAQARVALAGNTAGNSALTGVSSIESRGSFNLGDHAIVSTSPGVDLTNGGYLTLGGGASLSLGGALINSGSISAVTVENAGDTVNQTTTISATSLSNTGSIGLIGNSTDASQAIIDISGAAPTTWSGGLALEGHSLLEFGSGGIGTIASGGSIIIFGTNAHLSDATDTSANGALSTLTSNSGMLDLESGATLSLDPTGTLSNTGQILLDRTDDGGSTLNFGAVANAGTISAGSNANVLATSKITASTLNNTSTGRIMLFGDAIYRTTTVGPTMTVTGTTTNSNVIELIDPANLDLQGAVSGTGRINLDSGLSTAEFGAAVGNGQTIVLNTGNLKLDDPGEFAGTISGLAVGGSPTTPTNQVDLTTVGSATITDARLDTSSDVLSLDTTASGAITLQLSGSYTAGTFVDWNTDSNDSGSDIFLSNAVCYRRGTLILTDRGEVPVEELAIGDRVLTLSGEARPIRWIGRRAYDGRFIVGNRQVLPVRIAAGALADRVPVRDLWVSPAHSLYIDGVLVQAEHLVNGATIAQAEQVDRVEYFHIELDTHDIIFADGAPAESYVDCDNRLIFANAAEYGRVYSDDSRPRWEFCRPRLEQGSPALAAIRRKILARARLFGKLTADPGLHLVIDGNLAQPLLVANKRMYLFEVPAGARSAAIGSRTAVPVETEAARGDSRRLGVAVERIVLRGIGLRVEMGHDCPELRDGFHLDEDAHRWTDGCGRLPEALLAAFGSDFFAEVHLAETELEYGLAVPAKEGGPPSAPRPGRRSAAALRAHRAA